MMEGFEGLATLDLAVLDTKPGERIVVLHHGEAVGALVPLDDLRRLQALDARRQAQEAAARRGEPWERWEDALLRDTTIDVSEVASATQRTPHSITERRRWIRRMSATGAQA